MRVAERTAELARANEALEAERDRLFSFLDGLPFFVCLRAPDHKILFSNRCFRMLFPEGEPTPSYPIIPGSDASGQECPACRCRATGSRIDWEWTSHDGRHYQIYDSPFGPKGSETLVLEVGIDITERREAERALELERNKLLGILTSMREIVYIINRNYEIEFANPAFEEAFGGLVQGRKCHEQIHDRGEVCSWCRNQEVFSGHSISWEWTSPTDSRTYDVFDAPLLNKDGSISKLKILHDITGLKRTEEDLRQSQQELQRGVGDRLPVIWSYGVRTGRITPNQFVALTSTNPAKIFGLYPQKGTLLPGSDADIVIWDPNKKITYGVNYSHQRTDYNLYEGWELVGYPEKVLLRGQFLVDGDRWLGKPGMGQYVHRKPFAMVI